MLQDSDLARWHANVGRGSPITADVYARRLAAFCEQMGIEPKALAELPAKELRDLLLDFVSAEEKKHRAGSYIQSTTKAVKSWLVHNDLLSEASKRTRSFDLVVFTSLSRMTRGGVEAALYVLHRLQSSGVGWHVVEQPILNFDSTTPILAQEIVLAVLAAIDKDYRARIARATRCAYLKRKNLAEAAGEKIRWGRPPGAKNRKKRGPLGPAGRSPA